MQVVRATMEEFSYCANVSFTKLKTANRINCVVSAVCLVFLLLFLALLILYRTYKTTLQRLFLYLTITSALDAIITILNVELQFRTNYRLKLCESIGFLFIWVTNLIGLFSFALIVYLTITAHQTF